MLLSNTHPALPASSNKFVPATQQKNLPASFDWRDKGAVTSVKDQGTLGTCWIFSTIGNLEGQMFLSGKGLTDLSVEHILECDAMTDESANVADCGVFGGWPYLAMQGIIERGGVFSDKDYPYCAGTVDEKTKSPGCLPCMPDKYSMKLCGDHTDDDGGLPLYCEPETTLGQGPKKLCARGENSDLKFAYSIGNWTDASSTLVDDISSSLMELGPLSVAVDATPLQFYKGGVSNPRFCSSKEPNHAVLMVGYGTASNGGDFFTIKNSWGKGWGEDGYFRIAKKDGPGTCAVNSFIVSALPK